MPASSRRQLAEAPSVAAPPAFAERRVAHRRASDRAVEAERTLVARGLDVLVAEHDPDARLAALLALVARTLGAERAAVRAGDGDPRIAVGIAADGDVGAATALARWLDAVAPRSRAQRAADPPATVRLVSEPPAPGPERLPVRRRDGTTRHALQLPSGGALALDLPPGADPAEIDGRFTPGLAHDVAALLALVTRDHARDREIAELRARERESATFVSTVAHELRTPLTGLGGYLDLLLDGRVDDPAIEREFLARGRAIVSTVAELVGDLLDLSRLEAGSVRLDIRPFSIAEALAQVTTSLDPLAMERGVSLRTSLPPRMRMAVGDRRRVEQIVLNLAGNAVKFVPPGGRVEVTATVEGPYAAVTVRDDGPGILPDERARIFDRFYRVAAHERVTGSGLGLAIARDLARSMDGDLDVASVPGSGSSFVLVLPAAGPQGAAAVDGAADGPAAEEERDDELAALLAAIVAAEEIVLEERAVLRALEEAGRPAGRRPIRLASHRPGSGGRSPAEDARDARQDRGSVARDRDAGPDEGTRKHALRAIDGGALRTSGPTSA